MLAINTLSGFNLGSDRIIGNPTRQSPLIETFTMNTPILSLTALVAAIHFWSPGNSYANTYTVVTTADSGIGSLRQAIDDANSSLGTDTIAFDIPGQGPHTIRPLSSLPTVTDPVVIDGYSQPGSRPNTLAVGDNAILMVELNGASAGSAASGLSISAGASAVRGLVINNFGSHGIVLSEGGANVVAGNFLGTDATGSQALGNAYDGIFINNSGGNIVGGQEPSARNIISGNGNYGIEFLSTGSANLVQGNYLGMDATGTQGLPGQPYGILIQGSGGHLLGGTTPAARNVILASGVGIIIYSPNNVVQGNYVGVDALGSRTFSLNGSWSIFRGFYVATEWAEGNQIGGTVPGAGNVVSGCESGIFAEGCHRNRFQGNTVGADASGTLALGNALGIVLQGGSEHQVEGNLVVASSQAGIVLNWVSAADVEGNIVGTDRTRTLNLRNQIGIYLEACSGTKLGGTEDGAANTIAFSRLDGVVVRDDPQNPVLVQANSIRGNSIWQNGGLGINLVPAGLEPVPWSDWEAPVVTLNDLGDADVGPNGLQNYPVIGSAAASTTRTTITGTFNSGPGANYILDFYANSTCDPMGHGEGERYLGSASVVTDSHGDATFSVVLPVGAPVGWTITATATDPAGNTSEFSACSAPVVQSDITPPTISGVTVSPVVLWPANHRLILITIDYTTADESGVASCILSATSSEPDNGPDDGDTSDDIRLIPGDAHHLWLRAERDGNGPGRIYTVTVTCTDECGNAASKTVSVAVPRSRGKQ